MDPWERQYRETPKAFDAFRAYRDASPAERSIAKCCRAYYGDTWTKSKFRRWEKWSARYGWVRRVQEWDSEKDRASREADLKAIADMRDKHIRAATGLLSIGLQSMARFQTEMRDHQEFRLAPSVMLQFIQQATEIERKARGEPDQIIKALGSQAEVVVLWGDGHDPEDNDEGPDAEAAPGPTEGSG